MSSRGKPIAPQSQSRPTTRDVARRAKVSKSLVSMVTRGEDGVSAEKREAILEAIEELSYRPNVVVAPSLIARSTTGPPRDDRNGLLDSVKTIQPSRHLSDNE